MHHQTTSPPDLLSDFHRFLLTSSKNTEQFSPDLLGLISVPTVLDELVLAAVQRNLDVVIAGTAGSGKTHLLERFRAQAGDLCIAELETDTLPTRKSYVKVVSDLTALPMAARGKVFDRPRHCLGAIVCANEGALLLTARTLPRSSSADIFSGAIRALHDIQGGAHAPIAGGTVVIDAAGFDPSASGVLTTILGSPHLRAVVDTYSGCDCDEEECPRRRAWRQLADEGIRSRLSQMIAAAALEVEGFTFRQLWNFVSDLALGGTCAESSGRPASSPWFWRVFKGSSQISERLSEVYPLRALPMPALEARLWHGDWSWLTKSGLISDGGDLMIPPRRPCEINARDALEVFEWLKAQAAFLAKANGIESAQASRTGTIWQDLRQEHPHSAIAAIASYMNYGLAHPSGALELWVDYSMERRLERPDGQVSLGRPGASEFQVARSLAVANAPHGIEAPRGSRMFLRHRKSNAVLPLTREFLATIQAGRSFRMADRANSEVDWLLVRFFSDVGLAAATPERLRVALFDFSSRERRQFDWDVSSIPPSVVFSGQTL